MSEKKFDKIPSSEITPRDVYKSRRTFMKGAALAGSVIATGGVYKYLTRHTEGLSLTAEPKIEGLVLPSSNPAVASTQGFITREAMTSLEKCTHYNNYYEFTTTKENVAQLAMNFVMKPWSVEVGGLCAKPQVFDLDDLAKIAPPEERVYRMRCVERWSMVIPWDGFSLSRLLDYVQPKSSAKYVAFTSFFDPNQMPGRSLPWPYVEGLRMDEAMHPLTILATGLYGQALFPQNGGPIRLVTPWKYGFKGIKAIHKIDLVEVQPDTTWSLANPDAYGFYCNVNPEVARPWDQSTEDRVGEGPRQTLAFNGYKDQVGHLYSGMDLSVDY